MGMATLEERIAQWEKMAREAPDDMAYFSLGSAYKDADRLQDAEQAFARAIEMNPGMSRAYQLRGQVLIKLGRIEEAADVLTRGYEVAAQRRDVMPQRAIGSLLEKIGRPVPQTEQDQAQEEQVPESTEGMILDRRTGRWQRRLDDPPMRGPVGRFIYDHFGQDTWRTWIAQGTKVINELRLDFSNPQHQDVYDQYMLEWLQVSPQEIEEYARKTEPSQSGSSSS